MLSRHIKLTDLPDEAVLALRSNEAVSLWYNGAEVKRISVTSGGGHYAKYRISLKKGGQYRNDNPTIEFMT